MSDSIKVAIKIRPLIKREKDDNLPVQWEFHDKTIFSVDPETKKRGEYSHIFGKYYIYIMISIWILISVISSDFNLQSSGLR